MKLRSLVLVLTIIEMALLPSHAANAPTPDAKVGKKPANQKGNNIYNGTGAGQSVGIRANRRGKAKFFFTAQNDDPIAADTLTTRASRRNRKFIPKYIQIAPAAGNVTAEITGAGRVSGLLAIGAEVQYKAVVKTKSKFRDRRVRRVFLIDVTAEAGGTPDQARAIVKKKP